jgi:hypothetical protein
MRYPESPKKSPTPTNPRSIGISPKVCWTTTSATATARRPSSQGRYPIASVAVPLSRRSALLMTISSWWRKAPSRISWPLKQAHQSEYAASGTSSPPQGLPPGLYRKHPRGWTIVQNCGRQSSRPRSFTLALRVRANLDHKRLGAWCSIPPFEETSEPDRHRVAFRRRRARGREQHGWQSGEFDHGCCRDRTHHCRWRASTAISRH